MGPAVSEARILLPLRKQPIEINDVREPMTFKRIDHVEIVTDQQHRTVQFYTEVLGFRVKALDRIVNQIPTGTPPPIPHKCLI